MNKEKITHIFNRNHIEILKIERPEGMYPSEGTGSVAKYKYDPGNNRKYTIKKETIKKESPLGFYYTQTKERKIYSNDENSNAIGRTIIQYRKDNIIYQLKYVTQFNDNISTDKEDGIRPWDVYPGDKDFPDHMITALVKDVENYFEEAANRKIDFYKYKYNGFYWNSYYDGSSAIDEKIIIKELRDNVFKDLFGNVKGPRFQSNKEKIIAHGFDLKTSFRKDKEKK